MQGPAQPHGGRNAGPLGARGELRGRVAGYLDAVSMIGNIRLATDAEIEALYAAPERIEDFLYGEDDSFEPPDDMHLELDKAWHGIHFLLTGEAWSGAPPLDFIVSGGREVGDEDVGYGPARAFSSDEVAQVAAALDPITPDTLRDRFDGRRMMLAQIYPEIWNRDPADDDTLGYLVEYFEFLKPFIAQAAERRLGMLVYIN
jgi:hypothetical protein